MFAPYILVHQTRLSHSAVSQDDDLFVSVSCPLSYHISCSFTFNRIFFREAIAFTEVDALQRDVELRFGSFRSRLGLGSGFVRARLLAFGSRVVSYSSDCVEALSGELL